MEVGCGFGRNLAYIVENKFSQEYAGIDITDTAIKTCAETLKYEISEGILKLTKENAGEKVNYPDEHFDCVFDIMSAITFIVDENERMKYFSEVKRVLKQGGVYFFLAARKEGEFKDAFPDENLLEKGFIKRQLDSMLERVYSYDELVSFLNPLVMEKMEINSEHMRAFGTEIFTRKNGFWFGIFRKR